MTRTRMLQLAVVAMLFGLTRQSNAQPPLNTAFEEPPSNRLSVTQLDPESQRCMACHNGTLGPRIELRPAGAPMEFEFGRTITTTNHAIGMSYRTAYDANSTEYVSPEALNPNVRLVDGKVGCLSCHVRKEVLIAQVAAFIESPETQCTFDKEATRRELGGLSCLTCHIK